jgi:outer membrane protein OmpA-like peptidoglycan-associated protein
MIMPKFSTIPLTLITIGVMSGCGSVPPNPALTQAHNNYNSARSNAEVVSSAPIELQDASNSLSKADQAFSEDEEDAVVNHLAYLANQQVSIAQEVAKRKTAETAVTTAGAKRDQVRLVARTAEADTAKQQLAIAGANSERDKALIAEQEAQLKALNATKTERGMMITLGDVLFSTNKAQLKSGGVRNIEKLGIFLTQYPEFKVSIEGHTDSRGTEEHNQELSEARANTVHNALMDMSISSERVATIGYGENFPIASNDNSGGRQLNRRVEIILSDANGNIIPR